MLKIKETLVSLDIIEKKFFCDLDKCKGLCCIEGDAGAPVEKKELDLLKKYFPIIKKYLPEEHLKVIKEKGLYEKDQDGDWVTSCHSSGACVFVTYDKKGVAKCAFQKAYEEGEIDWTKPISCYLYPIRIAHYPEFTAVNYAFRSICKVAEIKGQSLNIRVYEFLEKPLRLFFGDKWYEELKSMANEWSKQKEKS